MDRGGVGGDATIAAIAQAFQQQAHRCACCLELDHAWVMTDRVHGMRRMACRCYCDASGKLRVAEMLIGAADGRHVYAVEVRHRPFFGC